MISLKLLISEANRILDGVADPDARCVLKRGLAETLLPDKPSQYAYIRTHEWLKGQGKPSHFDTCVRLWRWILANGGQITDSVSHVRG